MNPSRLLAAPLILYLIVFFYAPLLYIALVGASIEGFPRSYIEAVSRPEFHVFYIKGAAAATIATLMAIILSVPVAFYAAYYARRIERALIVVAMVSTFWVDVLLRALSLKLLFQAIGVSPGFWPMVVGLAYEVLPIVFIASYLGASQAPRELIDAARTLGAGPLQAFARVALPISAPWIAAGAAASFVYSFADYAVPSLLGGTTGFTVGNLIYTLILEGDRWGVGSAVAVMLTLVSAAGAALLFGRLYRIEVGR